MGTWRQCLDETTTWAVTLMAAILTCAFSSPDNPHYILLTGIVVVTIFLGIGTRRYRDYDVFRSRVRVSQQNLFANALDPSEGIERHDRRVELSRDNQVNTESPVYEALTNRLRRVYLALLSILLAMGLQDDWVHAAPGLADNCWNRSHPRRRGGAIVGACYVDSRASPSGPTNDMPKVDSTRVTRTNGKTPTGNYLHILLLT